MDSKLGDGVKGVEGAAQLYSGGEGGTKRDGGKRGPAGQNTQFKLFRL